MVKYLKYKGKEIPVRLSYLVFKGLKEELKGAEVQVDAAELNPDVMEAMLYLGLKSGHRALDIPFDITKDQMEDILDECFVEFLQMVPEFFPQANLGNALKNLGNLNQTEGTFVPIEGSIV